MDTAVLLYEKFILQKVNYKKIYIYIKQVVRILNHKFE